MRKQQLENLKVGDKVQEYGEDKAIYTVHCLPDYEVEGLDKYIIWIAEEDMKLLSKSSLLKNYKLIEEQPAQEQIELAVTEEPEVMDIVGYLNNNIEEEISLTNKEKEFLYHMTDNYFSNILESGGEFTFAVIEQLSYSEKAARGVISSLIKKGLIEVEEQEDDHPVVSFTEKGKIYTEENLERLKIKRRIDKIEDPEIKAKAIKGAKDSIKKMKEKRKATKVENSEEITASQLAEELGITPQDLRRQLRKNKFTKPEQGWKWNRNSEEFKTVLSTLKQIQEKRAEKRRG